MATEEISEIISWAETFPPGSDFPSRAPPPVGSFTLEGKHSGFANVSIEKIEDANKVAVVYHNYTDDGINVLMGSESVTQRSYDLTDTHVDWFSDLEVTGPHNGTKMTSNDGFQVEIDVLKNFFNANGTMVTAVNGKAYYQPANGQ